MRRSIYKRSLFCAVMMAAGLAVFIYFDTRTEVRSGTDATVASIPIEVSPMPRAAMIQSFVPANINAHDIDDDGKTMLHQAAESGDMRRVEELIRLGGDANIQDDKGRTALHLAARNGHNGTVSTLVRMGANPWIKDDAGRTAKDYALQGGHTLTAQAIDRPQTAEASIPTVPQATFATSSPHRGAMLHFNFIGLICMLGLLILPGLLILLVAMRHHNRQRRQRESCSGAQDSRLRELARLAERMEARIANLETILAPQTASKEGGF